MPTLAQRITRAFSSFRMRWGRYGAGATGGGYTGQYGRLWGTLPGGEGKNYAQLVGDPELNSAASIGLNWIARQFVEPVGEVVYRNRKKESVPLESHPLTDLLNNPNPYYDGDTLLQASVTDYCIDGNAFWLLVKDNLGRVRELYHAPYWRVIPRWDGPDALITHYDYVADGQYVRLELDEVLHFRFGLDTYRRGRGKSRLRPVLRELFTDNEAATFEAAILSNMGVPGVLLQPRAPGPNATVVDAFTPESAAQLKRRWKEFTGTGRGEPLTPSVPLEVVKLSLNPNELTLTELRREATSRILAALDVPAMVIGMTVGDSQRTYSNMGEAEGFAYNNCIVPTGKTFAKTINRGLLPFVEPGGTTGAPRTGYSFRWDYSQITSMQDDLDKVFKRSVTGYNGGILTRDEARAMIGQPPVPAGEAEAGAGA